MGLFSKKRTSPPVQAAGYTAPVSHQANVSARPPRGPPVSGPKLGLLPLRTKPIHPSSPRYHLDVVALHGLDGDALTTWTNQYNQLWLQDLLPNSLPGARLYTFSYDCGLFSRCYSDITDYALSLLVDLYLERQSKPDQQRGLIFICHGMGGIVCKKAMVMAHEDPRYENIVRSTRAIFFFGTPQRGMPKADIGTILLGTYNVMASVTLTDRFYAKARQDLMASLKRQSRSLQDLAMSFTHRGERMEIFSFYEDPYFTKNPTVPRACAEVGVSTETMIALPQNHINMCKIENPTSTAYRIIVHTCQKYGATQRARR